MVSEPSSPSQSPSPRKLRWILGWIVAPLLVIGSLFALGVHVGARHPTMGLSRLLLWMFDAEPGVGAGPPARPRAEPSGPGISPDGDWIVGDFEIHMKSPAGAWLRLYGPKRGLDLAFGEPAPGTLLTRIEIEPVVDETLLEDRPLIWMTEGVDVDWVAQPSELRPGVSSWHLRGTEGDEVVDIVEFSFVDRRARSLLLCTVVVAGPEQHRRMDELVDQCEELDWSIADDRSPPSEARFAGHYVVAGLELEIPAPPSGFVFDHYMPGQQIDFIASARKLDSSRFMLTACSKDCDPALVEPPLEAITENRWRGGERRSDRLLGEVIATRPGTDSRVWCFFELAGADMNRGDELERRCLDLLANY